MQSETDHYAVLRLKPGSSIEEVRRQYRRLAKVYHPDRNPGEEDWCAEQLSHVNLAYEFLSNPERKKAYDLSLGGQKARVQTPPTPQPRNSTPSSSRTTASHQTAASAYRAPAVTKRGRQVEQQPYKTPTPRQIATILVGGAGVGVLGAVLSMALFNYLHPAQSRYTVLPAQTLVEKHKSETASKGDSENHVTTHHHVHSYHEARDLRPRTHEARSDGRQSEVDKLNKLGVKLPANEFSKQEMADMAARLQAYDKSH